MISLSRPARTLATGSQRRRFYSRPEGFANASTARGAGASLVKLCAGAQTSRQRPTGLGHHAHPGRLADFVDQNRSAVGQLAIPEGDGRGLKGEIEGGVNPDQPSPAHDSKLATVLVEKGLLATIEKCGFLGCGKHASGSGMTKGPSTKRTTRRATAEANSTRTADALLGMGRGFGEAARSTGVAGWEAGAEGEANPLGVPITNQLARRPSMNRVQTVHEAPPKTEAS
jgi:hypothetical protein